MNTQWPPPQLPEVLKIDGVDYRLPQWLEVGNSIFVPCLDVARVGMVVRWHYSPREWKVAFREAIECGVYGLRLWRVK